MIMIVVGACGVLRACNVYVQLNIDARKGAAVLSWWTHNKSRGNQLWECAQGLSVSTLH